MAGLLNPFTIGILLINLALAYHSIRNGHSPLWLLALAVVSFSGNFLFTIAIWLAYLFIAVIPDLAGSHGMRRFRSNLREAADPGRSWREKKRQVEMVGSVDAKRALAEESLKRGLHAEAIQLYESAMQGPLGDADATLLKGLGRAKLMAGDAAEAERLFIRVHELDPVSFDDVELDYAAALEAQDKTEAAIRQYESVAPRFAGEEAKVRLALLLEKTGQEERAQQIFREVLDATRDAPRYYRSRQTEWIGIARQHHKG